MLLPGRPLLLVASPPPRPEARAGGSRGSGRDGLRVAQLGDGDSRSRDERSACETMPILCTMSSPTGVCPHMEMPWYVVGSQVVSSSGVTTSGFHPTSSSKPEGVRQ